MKPDSLTDPTSLIACRLAHGETSRDGKRSTREAPAARTSVAPLAIVGLSLLLAAVLLIAHP